MKLTFVCTTLLLHLSSSQNVTTNLIDGVLNGHKTCDSPIIPHGYIWNKTNTAEYSVGYTLFVQCHTRYRVPYARSDRVKITCLEDGTWADLTQLNTAVACEVGGSCEVPLLNNGWVSPQDGGYMSGNAAAIECPPHYELQPPTNTHLLCLEGGAWYSGLPSRLPQCWAQGCAMDQRFDKGQMRLLLNGMRLDPAIYSDQVPTGTNVEFVCDKIYSLSGSKSATCNAGNWTDTFPMCMRHHISHNGDCAPPDTLPHSVCRPMSSQTEPPRHANGSQVLCKCDAGYVSISPDGASVTRSCHSSVWSGQPLQCVPASRGCQRPPEIEHGRYQYLEKDYSVLGGLIHNGTTIHYQCDHGFTLNTSFYGPTDTQHTCQGQIWSGYLPTCVKRKNCDKPQDIEHGNWVFEKAQPDFAVGTVIVYTCNAGYKALSGLDKTVLTCEESTFWSDYPPRCLPIDSYCAEPRALRNGYYVCRPPSCNLFKAGTEIDYMCERGYTLTRAMGGPVMPIVCAPDGKWVFGEDEMYCKPDNRDKQAKIHHSSNMSAVVIVVSTSLSVFAVLTIILIAMFLLKKIKRPVRTCRGRPMQSFCAPPPPPAYSEVPQETTEATVIITDTDRASLIQFPDGTQATLPSYTEVMRGRYPPQLHRQSVTSSTSRGGGGANEYRTLPTVSQQLRAANAAANNRESSPDHRDQISVQSYPRADGLSVTFGSIDTMNVSDNTSTTVTVSTYDSAASNPSLALSQRAAIGSLGSSSHSLANEDAPLIEPQDTISHRSITASPPLPAEDTAEQK